ncbi:sensor histidine kinase [Allonocardiopsis opalescens]|uniref:histidine kinase n=1 Tax=Allonocardiopsis opalescens TaxID=1144618 RepID=A0A2T0Q2P4_9ACTN|nr:HAMP domain-containing sensor histidine kinase [Allonocardiopsis opalescens]PRX97990.1 two-component system sensor histidine kinase MtrB [Allonocardiopsis opalescens]
MRRRLWPRGLRARLLVTFVLVTVLGAAAAAWSSAGSASTALVDSTQRRLTEATAAQIGALAPQLSYPPDQAGLDRLRAAVGPDTLVTYRHLRSADGAGAALVTEELREAVRVRGRLVAQRVGGDGGSWLLIGTPVMITDLDGTRTPSGIEVYAAHDLGDVERRIDGLTRSAIGTAALALPPAALLALLAARSVLRPVRELRDTARRLADGDLGARSLPQGADELAELTATVNEMAESVQASMAAMRRMQADARRFAADVSHELRTPLSTLTAVMEVLEDAADGMDPDARESARMAITETHRLVRLVEDLMEVSRFDAGTVRPRLEEVDVAGAVRDCLRARDWLDRVELTAPAESRSRLDRRRLDVIVANLVGNALRHGEPPVRVDVSASPGEVRIEVTDAGRGLPEDVLPHVFDRFYKADAARTRTPGSGLGLAIALENARLHGGDLTAGNADGGGARFVLRLPRGMADQVEDG